MLDFVTEFRERNPFFTEVDIEKFMSLTSIRTLASGELFVREGEYTMRIGIVLEGLLRVYRIMENGEEATTLFIWESRPVGSYASMFLGKGCTENIEAIEPVTLLTFDFLEFKQLCKREPQFMQTHLHMIEELLVENIKRIEDFIKNNPEQRYRRILEEQPFLIQRVQQRHLASFLGITPISLSRIKKRIIKK